MPDTATLAQLQARLIDMAHDAIFIRDPSSRIVAWNQGAQTLYGWTEQEAQGRTKLQLLHTPVDLLKVIDKALNETGYWEGLLEHTTRQGRHVIVESRQVLVRDEAGRPTAILEINRDVTQREHLLQERARAQAQELALQETIRQMDQFLSIASHELRTPVTSLKSMMQLMLRWADRAAASDPAESAAQHTQQQGDLLRRAGQQIDRLTRLLDDLLDYSRIRDGRLEFRLEPGDLRLWAADIIAGESASHPDRRIVYEPASKPVPVVADQDRISQVVTNYLTNALKYSPADRPVSVRLQQIEGYARLEVQDEGPGIPIQEQDRIWELFYRVPEIEVISGSGVGLGLGLYLCKTLVERHGGQVGVESAPGQGACFWFTLPLAAPQPEES
ncbi:MAG TPA: PAS domain-containing sensor histidine kinase [Ktedonobacterales bacterium]|nr:PAS domain-containing sensor histidine kinase [Ktedonobacterales bacterium]